MTDRIIKDAAFMTPPEMLAVNEKFMSGQPMTEGEEKTARHIAAAASFAACAWDRHPGCDGGAMNALLRAFLTALVDPLHPDLDYLRADPKSGPTARATRLQGAL